jgi:Photosystem I psaA/psaB protein
LEIGLVHRVIALGLHTTTLILVNDALDVRCFKLMPDKNNFGFHLATDQGASILMIFPLGTHFIHCLIFIDACTCNYLLFLKHAKWVAKLAGFINKF